MAKARAVTTEQIAAYVAAVQALLAENDDQALLADVAQALTTVAKRAVAVPVVISATPLNEAQQSQLRVVLDNDETRFVVDNSIGGGLIVEENGRRTDLSLKQRITS